jgi:hypothetical protein
MTMSEAEARAQGRKEAAPVALLVLIVFVVLALASKQNDWQLLNLDWWVWLVPAVPALLLTIDLFMARRGTGLVRSRTEALVLLAFLVGGNLTAVAILVGTPTRSCSGCCSGKSRLAGLRHVLAGARSAIDFHVPQDDTHRPVTTTGGREHGTTCTSRSPTRSPSAPPHAAALIPCESDDGAPVRDRSDHRAARGRAGRERSRQLAENGSARAPQPAVPSEAPSPRSGQWLTATTTRFAVRWSDEEGRRVFYVGSVDEDTPLKSNGSVPLTSAASITYGIPAAKSTICASSASFRVDQSPRPL